jgi:hypothetical protein
MALPIKPDDGDDTFLADSLDFAWDTILRFRTEAQAVLRRKAKTCTDEKALRKIATLLTGTPTRRTR